MSEKTKLQIQVLLQETKALLPTNRPKALKNYSSLKNAILLEELKQEIQVLEKMLHDYVDFEALFAARWQLRAVDQHQLAINFRDMPESTTNKLYWDIAKLVFADEAPEILSPGIKKIFSAEVSETLPEDMNSKPKMEYINKQAVRLTSSNLSAVKITSLSDIAFSDTEAFDLQSIQHFSLGMHQQVYQHLQTRHPDLARVVYSHNWEMQTLERDILLMQNKGKTPKEALECLRDDLKSAGSSNTGSLWAGTSAYKAYGTFMDYLDSIPISLKEQLLELKVHDKSLNDILLYLAQGNCVEGGSSTISEFLKQHANNPLLTNPVHISAESKTALRKKYEEKDGINMALSSAKCNSELNPNKS